jgi:hypothetical protein
VTKTSFSQGRRFLEPGPERHLRACTGRTSCPCPGTAEVARMFCRARGATTRCPGLHNRRLWNSAQPCDECATKAEEVEMGSSRRTRRVRAPPRCQSWLRWRTPWRAVQRSWTASRNPESGHEERGLFLATSGTKTWPLTRARTPAADGADETQFKQAGLDNGLQRSRCWPPTGMPSTWAPPLVDAPGGPITGEGAFRAAGDLTLRGPVPLACDSGRPSSPRGGRSS